MNDYLPYSELLLIVASANHLCQYVIDIFIRIGDLQRYRKKIATIIAYKFRHSKKYAVFLNDLSYRIFNCFLLE